MVLFGGLFSLPLASCQDNLQPTPSVKSLQLPNTMVYVGSSFVYNISEEVFDCEVESFVVSKRYSKLKTSFWGLGSVPTESDLKRVFCDLTWTVQLIPGGNVK